MLFNHFFLMDKVITTSPLSNTTTPSLTTTTTHTHSYNTRSQTNKIPITHLTLPFRIHLQKLIRMLEQLKTTKHHAKLAILKNNLPQHRNYRSNSSNQFETKPIFQKPQQSSQTSNIHSHQPQTLVENQTSLCVLED